MVCCKRSNEPYVSIKGGQSFFQLSKYQLLTQNPAPMGYINDIHMQAQ
jgi:hypothetical protein